MSDEDIFESPKRPQPQPRKHRFLPKVRGRSPSSTAAAGPSTPRQPPPPPPPSPSFPQVNVLKIYYNVKNCKNLHPAGGFRSNPYEMAVECISPQCWQRRNPWKPKEYILSLRTYYHVTVNENNVCFNVSHRQQCQECQNYFWVKMAPANAEERLQRIFDDGEKRVSVEVMYFRTSGCRLKKWLQIILEDGDWRVIAEDGDSDDDDATYHISNTIKFSLNESEYNPNDITTTWSSGRGERRLMLKQLGYKIEPVSVTIGNTIESNSG